MRCRVEGGGLCACSWGGGVARHSASFAFIHAYGYASAGVCVRVDLLHHVCLLSQPGPRVPRHFRSAASLLDRALDQSGLLQEDIAVNDR